MNSFKRLSLLISLMTTLFVGCSQEEDYLTDGYGGDPVTIKVLMGGAEGLETTPLSRSTDTTLGIERYVNTVRDSLSGLYVETTIERVAAEQKVSTRANLNNNSIFRMLIYKNDGTLVHNCDYTVNGTTATIVSGSTEPALIPGTYKFVCITKNNSISNPFAGTNVIVNSGEDFGTYVESKTISANDKTITINFKRQIAQFAVEVVGSGFKNNTPVISDNNINVNYLNASGTWVADNSATDNTELSISTSNVSKQTSNGATFLVIPMNNKNLSVSIPSLQFDGKTYSNINVPLNGITVARKGNYKMSVKLTKNTSDGIEYNDLIWAPGNLKYEDGIYSFMPSQEANTYIPEVLTHIDMFNVDELSRTDVCAKVLPKGRWRLSTLDELNELVKNFSYGSLNGIFGGYFGANNDVFFTNGFAEYYSEHYTNPTYYYSVYFGHDKSDVPGKSHSSMVLAPAWAVPEHHEFVVTNVKAYVRCVRNAPAQ